MELFGDFSWFLYISDIDMNLTVKTWTKDIPITSIFDRYPHMWQYPQIKTCLSYIAYTAHADPFFLLMRPQACFLKRPLYLLDLGPTVHISYESLLWPVAKYV